MRREEAIAVDLSLTRQLPHKCKLWEYFQGGAFGLGIVILAKIAGAAIRMARLRELGFFMLLNTCQMKQNLRTIESFKVGFL
jgi:hypothetical protein